MTTRKGFGISPGESLPKKEITRLTTVAILASLRSAQIVNDVFYNRPLKDLKNE